MFGKILQSRFRPSSLTTSFLLIALVILVVLPAQAENGRVFPEGKHPQDSRLGELKHLNAYFPFEPPATRKQWEKRAKDLRKQILVANGLWPMPKKTPLNAVVHGKVARAGFTVEKVYFESYPGYYVTGLLFRPEGKTGRLPAVLCPHGHGGRDMDHGKKIQDYIKKGDEKYEESGRFPKLARCAQLARMGCVTFIYDMIGYVDSHQVSYQVAHRFAKQRPELDTPNKWGFYGVQAELRLQSIMGLQTYNSIRALDFLEQLPDVDPQRMAVTGSSGGGTQTILLCAIDPRPIAAFPQGMVSTAMQGGCTCENCSLLRVGTGNVELTALFAPKPQGMTAANDWTKEMMTKGYPQLQAVYDLYGVKDKVLCKSLVQFGHNYNYVTRSIMYHWFNKHMNLGLKEPIVEGDYKLLSKEEYAVWNKEHPQPTAGDEQEVALIREMEKDSQHQIAALVPSDRESLKKYRQTVRVAFRTIIGRSLPAPTELEAEKTAEINRDGYIEFHEILSYKKYGEELPVVSFFPTKKAWNGEVVVWIDGHGKSKLYDKKNAVSPEVRKMLDAGFSVLGADLIYQGEFLADGKPLTEARKVANPREFAGYTYGYNHTVFAQRVHDVLTLVAHTQEEEHQVKKVHLVATNGAGPYVAAARAQLGKHIAGTVVDTKGFRFAKLKSFRNPDFLPGAVKYGDLPALLALAAPHPIYLVGENGKVPQLVSATYGAIGKTEQVHSKAGDGGLQAGLQWIIAGAQ
jgi:dienelactone hydrolase